MNEKKQYVYVEPFTGEIQIISEDELPKCPKTGDISPRVIIIGGPMKKLDMDVKPLNCRCMLDVVDFNECDLE